MRNPKAIFILLASLILFTGCVGPLLNHGTGRSLGSGNHNAKVIAALEGYYGFQYDYGFSDNFDLGVQYEVLSIGLNSKYSFINQSSGFSFAGTLGIGSTFGGVYSALGFNGSYKAGSWEPFASLRYTSVEVDQQEIINKDTGDLFTVTPVMNYDYTQGFLGVKYWFTDGLALNVELGSFVSSNNVDFTSIIYYSLGVDFLF